MASRMAQWRAAWVGLAVALGLHVTDEALTGFLPLYDQVAEGMRADHPWVPLPRFTFQVWLGGLIVGVLLLLALTPVVSRGAPWIRVVSVILGVTMTGNALGHLGASVYWGKLAPGVYSSPLLLIGAVALLVTASRARVRGRSTLPNKEMQLTKLRAAPVLQAEVPPCAPAGETDGATASQLIPPPLAGN